MRSLRLVALVLLSAFAGAQEGADLFVSPRRQALVIGAQEYVDDIGALSYAARDAREVATLLEERYGFEVDLLHDGERESGELQRDYEARLPTASVIHQALSKVTRDPSRRGTDLFLFYYCGHGENREGVGDVLLPTDTRSGSSDRLAIVLKEDVLAPLQAAEMDNVILLIDACREGASVPFGRELIDDDDLRTAVLLGCAPGGTSYEEAGLGHGAFTHVLLQALKGDRLADDAGGLWFSKLAAEVERGVSELSVRRDPPQQPVAIFDPRRDILLGAVPDVSVLVERLDGLSSEAAQAAILSAAGQMMSTGRGVEALPLIRIGEQLGDLSSEMHLNLAAWHSLYGDDVSAGGHYAEVRRRSDDEFRQLATALDDSGRVSLASRAEAARSLVGRALRGNGDHALVLMSVLSEAGDHHAASLLGEALSDLADEGRTGAFMRACAAQYDGDVEAALAAFEQAEELPGYFPRDEALHAGRFRLLMGVGRLEEAKALARAATERWPEDGGWHLAVAAAVKARTEGRPEGYAEVHACVARALELRLRPDEVLAAVELDLTRVASCREDLERWAEAYPMAWRPALAAALIVQDPMERQARVEAAIDSAANPHLAKLTALRIVMDQTLDTLPHPSEVTDVHAYLGQLMPFVLQLQAEIQSVLGHLGEEPLAWSLFADICVYTTLPEDFVRAFEQAFGERIEAGRVPSPLVLVAAPMYLTTGRYERFRQLRGSLPYESLASVNLRWAEAAYLLACGDDHLAKQMVEEDWPAPYGDWHRLDNYLAAHCALKDGEFDEARRLLVEASDAGPGVLPLHALIHLSVGERESFEGMMSVIDHAYVGEGFFLYLHLLFFRHDVSHLHRMAVHLPGMPITRAVRLGDAPIDGERSFRIQASGDAVRLGVSGWSLSLVPRSRGRVLAELTSADEETIWTLSGSLDEYGNLDGRLLGSEPELQLLAKIACDPSLLPQGLQQLVLYGPNGERFVLFAEPIE